MASKFQHLIQSISKKKHKKVFVKNTQLLGEIKAKITENTYHIEHKLFHQLRNKQQISFINKMLLTTLCVVLAIAGIILPIIPGLVFLIIPLILFLPARKLKHIIKLRRSIVYLLLHIRNRKIIKYKLRDIGISLKLLFFEKKKKYILKDLVKKSHDILKVQEKIL